ncbi:MAG TPA: C4-dicarboxylate ABC transporter [Candidatus Aminicenantes bacterium]|nr:C4-dicarboxylate ABC transporter [Candidatus Aminicenantes bacterium]HEB36926.1 C4-dicarboxylate ABC transporter [Candidatus Aminicenantes bacterium]
MYFQIGIILTIMVMAYALAKWKKLSIELSMLSAAVGGGIAGAFVSTPPIDQLARHLVEGAFTYLDVILVFSTATIFMAIVRESGGVNYVVRGTIKYFYNLRIIALILLMIIVLIPGALTGAGSVSLLVVGAPVALALGYLGIAKKRVAAILFIVAGLSAAAPPVNIWAMILSAGTAIPYVGFELPLGIPVLLLGTFTVLFLGWRRERKMELEEVLKEMPEVPAGMSWWRVFLPFLVFFGLVVASRLWPFSIPMLGLPLQFAIAALVALLVSPKRIKILVLSRDTMKRLLPLLATMIVVGMLQQIMTATGVRGLLSFAVISTPLILLFILLAVIIPVSEGVLTYGAAAIIGIPLIWFLDSIGLHATVAIAGLSLLWPLGDGLPPTALIGRLSVMVSEYKDSYWTFLKATWVPWVIITIVGILMVIFSARLEFLVRWSM